MVVVVVVVVAAVDVGMLLVAAAWLELLDEPPQDASASAAAQARQRTMASLMMWAFVKCISTSSRIGRSSPRASMRTSDERQSQGKPATALDVKPIVAAADQIDLVP